MASPCSGSRLVVHVRDRVAMVRSAFLHAHYGTDRWSQRPWATLVVAEDQHSTRACELPQARPPPFTRGPCTGSARVPCGDGRRRTRCGPGAWRPSCHAAPRGPTDRARRHDAKDGGSTIAPPRRSPVVLLPRGVGMSKGSLPARSAWPEGRRTRRERPSGWSPGANVAAGAAAGARSGPSGTDGRTVGRALWAATVVGPAASRRPNPSRLRYHAVAKGRAERTRRHGRARRR